MKRVFVITALIGISLISCFKDEDDHLLVTMDCDSTAEVISEDDYREINTSNYGIVDIQLNGNCLEVTISSSGCDPEPWEMNLYSMDAFYTVYPLQRAIKIELINKQLCTAALGKTVSFDLTPFQLETQNVLTLNIEGWNEQIIYKY